LLLARSTRRSGVAAIVFTGVATSFGLLVLAFHGGSPSPGAYLHHFDVRTGTSLHGSFACSPANASPAALACQAFGVDAYAWTRPLVIATVMVVVGVVGYWLRRAAGGSLVVFAWAGLLSPMLGTVQWTHYGICLAPMVLWIAASLFTRPRNALLWLGLVVGWALADLFWAPAVSVPAQLRGWFGGAPETIGEMIDVIRVSALAQVVLAIAGFLSGRDDPPERAMAAVGPTLDRADVYES
jgi:hypothetical protein